MNDNVKKSSGNVFDLFGNPVDTDKNPERLFEVTTVDGMVHLEEGFVCVTPNFVAIANAKGDINFVAPMDSLLTVRAVEFDELVDMAAQDALETAQE